MPRRDVPTASDCAAIYTIGYCEAAESTERGDSQQAWERKADWPDF